MSLKRATIATLFAVCSFAATAAAQRNELSGILGRTFISDQGIPGAPAYDPELRFGKGLTFEVNYARRVIVTDFWSLSLEFPFVVNPDEDAHTYASPFLGYRSYLVTPSARLNVFPEVAVSPWVSLGGGFGSFSGNSINNGNVTGLLQGGVGLDVKISRQFRLRGEARDFWSGVPQLNVNTGKSRQHNFFVGGGVVWQF